MLALAFYFLFLCLLRTATTADWFNFTVAVWITLAYYLTPSEFDGEPIRDNDPVYMVWNPGAIAWAQSWVQFYVAYLMVDTATQLNVIAHEFALHHAVALLAYAANCDSVFGAMVLFNVFVIEPSTVLVNLRFAMRSQPRKFSRATKDLVDCIAVPVYLWLRCFVFPYRLYRCFFEVLPQLDTALQPSGVSLYVGVFAISISLLLNFYWSALILKRVPAKLGLVTANTQKYYASNAK